MKELSKLSIQYCKVNKLRTLFTFLCMLIPVVCLTCFILLEHASSAYTKQQVIYLNGNYQLHMSESQRSQLSSLLQKDQIKEEVSVADCGVIRKDDGTYILVKSIDKQTSIQFLQLWEGVLPKANNEVLISKRYAKQHEVSVGQEISFTLGERSHNQEKIAASDSVLYDEESYQVIETYQNMIISGIYEPQISSNSQAIQDEMVLYQVEGTTDTTYMIVQDSATDLISYLQNNYPEVLNQTGVDLLLHQTTGNSTLAHLLQLFILLISILMLFLMKNIFTISIHEKKKLIGMLKSMGASEKQLVYMIFIESLLYSVVVIPIGMLIGYGVAYGLLQQLSQTMLALHLTPLSYQLIVKGKDMFFVASIVWLIMFLSGLLALRKLRHNSIIMLIVNQRKNTHTYKRTHRIVEKVFGSSAALGLRYQKSYGKKQWVVKITVMMSFVMLFASSFLIQSLYPTTKVPEGVSVRFKNVSQYDAYQTLQRILEESKTLASVEDVQFTSSLNINDTAFPKDMISEVTKEQMQKQEISSLSIQMIGLDSSKLHLDKGQGVLQQTYRFPIASNEKQTATYFQDRNLSSLTIPIRYYRANENIYETLSYPLQLVSVKEEMLTSAFLFNSSADITFSPNVYVSIETISDLMQQRSVNQMNELEFRHAATYTGSDQEQLFQDLNKLQANYPDWILEVTQKQIDPAASVDFSYYIILIGMLSMIVSMSIVNLFCMIISQILSRREENFVVLSLGLEKKQIYALVFFEHAVQQLNAFVISIPISILLAYGVFQQFFPMQPLHIGVGILGLGCLLMLVFLLLIVIIGYRVLQEDQMVKNLKSDS